MQPGSSFIGRPGLCHAGTGRRHHITNNTTRSGMEAADCSERARISRHTAPHLAVFATHTSRRGSAHMIADLLNTLVGLWLTHTAIFPDAAGTGRDRYVLIAAIGTIVLA